MRLRLILALLAVALLAGLTGCSAAGSIHLTPVDDTQLAQQASRSPPPTADSSSETARIVDDAVHAGSAEANDTHPPVETEGLPWRVDGTYYTLSVEAVDNHTETQVSLTIDYDGSAEGRAIDYAELPPVDQALVDNLLPPRGEDHGEGYDMGVGERYCDADLESSVLFPQTEYESVRYDGKRYPIKPEVDRRVTVTTYRYTATEVYPSDEAYGRHLRNEYTFTLSGLSSDEQEIVGESIGDTYYAESSDDSAFESVVREFRRHEAVRVNEYSGSWVVRYEDQLYWAQLRYEGYDFEE